MASNNEEKKILYENKFNTVIISMIDHIKKFYNLEQIDNMYEQFENILMESPSGPICCFLKYIYVSDEYRKNIMEMNEKFFIGDQTSNLEISKDIAIIESMFPFKKTWLSFKKSTRIYIMKCMKALVLICTKYIEYL